MAGPNCNCRGGLITVFCPQECPDTPTIGMSSINLSGVAVLDSWNGTQANFRGIASANGMITATLDSVNHTVLLTAIPSAIAAALPAATTTQVGVLETATDAEAQAKSATDKTLTPSNLAALGASMSFTGLIEIATTEEVVTGTSETLAVTPKTLKDQTFFSLAANAANETFGDVTLTLQGGSLTIDGLGAAGVYFKNAFWDYTDICTLSFGGVLAVNSLVGGNGDGNAVPYPVSDFLSNHNTQSGWGDPTGILTRTTFAGVAPVSASVGYNQSEVQSIANTASIVSQRLAALITDLKALKLPIT